MFRAGEPDLAAIPALPAPEGSDSMTASVGMAARAWRQGGRGGEEACSRRTSADRGMTHGGECHPGAPGVAPGSIKREGRPVG